MLKKLTIIALIAVTAIISNEVYANDEASTIKSLPTSGKVVITGIVDRVSDSNKFMLKDTAGKTIDVNTNNKIDVDKGDKVTVTGDLSDEAMGVGKEINNALVKTIDADHEDENDSSDEDDNN